MHGQLETYLFWFLALFNFSFFISFRFLFFNLFYLFVNFFFFFFCKTWNSSPKRKIIPQHQRQRRVNTHVQNKNGHSCTEYSYPHKNNFPLGFQIYNPLTSSRKKYTTWQGPLWSQWQYKTGNLNWGWAQGFDFHILFTHFA